MIRSIEVKMIQIQPSYSIIVYDNYHYQESGERFDLPGSFSAKGAITRCQQIVEENLANFAEPGRLPEAIYRYYTMFGDNPVVVSPDGVPPIDFSAWDYAKANAHRFVRPA